MLEFKRNSRRNEFSTCVRFVIARWSNIERIHNRISIIQTNWESFPLFVTKLEIKHESVQYTPCEGNTIIKIKKIIIINQWYYQQIFINRCTNLNAHLAFDNWDIMILKKEPLIYPVLFVPIFSHSRKRESHVLLFANYFQPSLTACFKFHGISRRIITSNAKSYFISPARITDFIHHALLHFRCFSAGGRENNFTRSYRKLRFPQL